MDLRRIAIAALGVALGGCRPDRPEPRDDLAASLRRAGFDVGEGAFVVSDMSGCCNPGADCIGNNPATPYGTPALPPAPGQGAETADDPLAGWGPVPAGLARTFHLRSDEAILTFGTLPPPAAYFSFRSYLAERPGVSHAILGSLGASLNDEVIEQERGAPAWGEPFAVITSFDRDTEDAVREALAASGWDPDRVDVDRIAGGVAHPGLDEAADTFFAIERAAIWDDPDAGAAWMADPPVRVLRLTPARAEASSSPWPWPALPVRGTGRAEDPALLRAAQDLARAVVAREPDRQAFPSLLEEDWAETVQCASVEGACYGDIRDRYTATSPTFALGPDEAVVAIGVDHRATGKASYSNVTIESLAKGLSIATLESPDMTGASGWGAPSVDGLYAWVVARDCTGWPSPCATVPHGCPGAEDDEPVDLIVRSYLERATGTAPLGSELIPDVAIKFGPRSAR